MSDFAVTVPELGTFVAEVPPLVILTSNRTRDLHDALKRRCLYHWVDHPSIDREVAIVRLRVPEASERLARRVAAAVEALRGLDLYKPPGVAETIDWARALAELGEPELAEIDIDAHPRLGAEVSRRHRKGKGGRARHLGAGGRRRCMKARTGLR